LGTSALGNLFVALDERVKCAIVNEYKINAQGPLVFDTAGKYGAGLALESLGNCLRECRVNPEDVIISNKLAWVRTELKTAEPTFEPGVWKGLKYDAIQDISYDGMIRCFEQGNDLLGGYIPQFVSLHDPDEYMATAKDEDDALRLYNNILEAYKALIDLKNSGKVSAIGVGAKSWKIIERITGDVKLDWVMIANSMTIKNHPKELLTFMEGLEKEGIAIINSAVFHSGFLIGGDYYDYKLMTPENETTKLLFEWRKDFFDICTIYKLKPAAACVQFALSAPGVVSIALSTTAPQRVKENLELAFASIPEGFWVDMKAKGLIDANYHYV
jgi:D-threo-aldose 1-dehydrogenase